MVAFAQVQAKQEPNHYDEVGSANDAGIWHLVRTSDRSSRATSLFHPIPCYRCRGWVGLVFRHLSGHIRSCVEC